MIETGTLLHERFLIEAQIGVGGMGAVYRATDRKFGSAVAIKETFFNDPELAEAFEREARLLNGLHHPIFPHVSDHFTENDGHFLVMEYIEGEDLSDLIKRGDRFDLDTVTRWTFDLLDGLDYLHSQDPPIIHRDIKPSNLKLTSRGNIVLLDFGMAKETSGNTQGMRSVFGYSRRYSPLEQIEGTGTDFRSDIFSLGATIFHLLTGTPPVDVLKRASSIIGRRPDPLELASDLNIDIPERVAVVINSALSLDPGERFVSARAMWNALEHALTAERSNTGSVVAAARPAGLEDRLPSESSFPALAAFEAEVADDVSDPHAVSAFRSVADDYDPIAALVAQRVSQMKAAEAGQVESGAGIEEEGAREPITEPVFVQEEFEQVEAQHLDSVDTNRERIIVPVLEQEPAEINALQHLDFEDRDTEETNVPPSTAVAPDRYAAARRYNLSALIGIPLILLVLGVLGYVLIGESASRETAEEAPIQENGGPAGDSVASQSLPAATPETAISSTTETANDSPPESLLSPEEPTRETTRREDGSELARGASEPRTQPEARRNQSSTGQSEPPASSKAVRSTRPRVVDHDSSQRAPVSSIESIMTGVPNDRTRRQQRQQWEVWQEDQLRRERRQRRINRRNRQNWPPF